MLGKLISSLDSLIYTFLAFIVPLYWTCKALLRQFTHSAAVASKTAAPVGEEEESVVFNQAAAAAAAAETDDIEMSSIPVSFSPSKPRTAAAPAAETVQNAAAQSVLVNWLYYWALLSVFHVSTRAYELLLLPLLGNSVLYRLGKLGVLAWMNHDGTGTPARLAWNSVLGPVVSAYERDVDACVARAQVAIRASVARFYASGREFVKAKFAAEESACASPVAELKVD